MSIRQFLAAISVSVFGLASLDSSAAIDNAATKVLLQTSCDNGAGGTLDNCFTTTADLVSWTTTVRRPNADNPLTVQIGPGTFGALLVTCNPAAGFDGHITFAGSGRERTIFHENAGTNLAQIANCTGLAFDDLAMKVDIPTSYSHIFWSGGGSSVWQNVDISGSGYGWRDSCGSGQPGKHYPESTIGSTAAFSRMAMVALAGDHTIRFATKAGSLQVNWNRTDLVRSSTRKIQE